MSNAVTTVNTDKIMELLSTGNLDQFTPKEKVQYINMVCEATGLNPLTRPFEFLRLQGKTVLYASKTCADQLRKIHHISIKVTEKKIEEGVLFMTVEASEGSGRVDTDIGALPVSNLKGDALANAVMKCMTKAKRRVTLSICGLGMLDEAELDTIEQEVEQGKVEQARIDAAKERIEKKIEIAENTQEVESIIDLIKVRLGILAELFGAKTVAEKGKLMVEHVGVGTFGDIKKKSFEEIKAINNAMGELIEEKKKRNVSRPTFVLEP
jgi:hypothetical protein